MFKLFGHAAYLFMILNRQHEALLYSKKAKGLAEVAMKDKEKIKEESTFFQNFNAVS